MDNILRANEMTWEEFKRLSDETDIAIIPVGVIEHHGLHAPTGLDTFVSDVIARKLAQRVKALLLPPVHYGCLRVTKDATMWPGTISVGPETLISLYTEIGTEVARHGFRRIVFVNSHIANGPMLEIAISKIRERSGAVAGIIEWWDAARGVVTTLGLTPDHGGEVETSLLLASEGSAFLKPDRAVANPYPKDSPSLSSEEYETHYVRKTKFTRDMDKRYIGESGNYGDPSKATKEKGDRIVDAAVEGGVILLKTLEKYTKK